ncbi:Protein of unknown function DUF58 [Verrucomicrobium sp. GAS474]|uniref:DUF58 domain-containing protein n=1 Tax=Verrucomicrobium sp. GAS474 TaxID=1882831 RepID=UPI00087C1C25|nr:DUF58 domain-containing protein [Verrucomicrobium sp. GAS474]SDU12847.1 Protein of unknown function DUF58 [Verrucomicrobium sp. GAS474]
MTAVPATVFSSAPRPGGEVDMGLLADLPGLELQARCVMDGFLAGRHRSPRQGSSVEFAEYRSYQFGDDPRRIDWRLYGRTERLHVKRYEEETQLRVILILDASASMDYRSREGLLTKLDFARITLAATALLAKRQQDAFGLAVAGPAPLEVLRARSSAPHWRTFLGRLQGVETGGEVPLAATLEEIAETLPRRSLVVIASDFYDETEALAGALRRLRHDRHDVVGLQICDPFELDFALDAQGTFVDLESGQRLLLDTEAVRAGYLERFGAFRAELAATFRDVGAGFETLSTARAPLDALTAYLAIRQGGQGGEGRR